MGGEVGNLKKEMIAKVFKMCKISIKMDDAEDYVIYDWERHELLDAFHRDI